MDRSFQPNCATITVGGELCAGSAPFYSFRKPSDYRFNPSLALTALAPQSRRLLPLLLRCLRFILGLLHTFFLQNVYGMFIMLPVSVLLAINRQRIFTVDLTFAFVCQQLIYILWFTRWFGGTINVVPSMRKCRKSQKADHDDQWCFHQSDPRNPLRRSTATCKHVIASVARGEHSDTRDLTLKRRPRVSRSPGLLASFPSWKLV